MEKEYIADINNSISTIIVIYMGRNVAAEVTGFLKFNNKEDVARVSIRNTNYRNEYDYLLSLSSGRCILNTGMLSVDNKTLVSLKKLRDDYYMVRGIIDS